MLTYKGSHTKSSLKQLKYLLVSLYLVSIAHIHPEAMRFHQALSRVSKIITMELSGSDTACCIDKIAEDKAVDVSSPL
jgi:hypothetical protein